MREQGSPEIDLNRPLGGRIGLVLLGAAAIAGLVQGLGSILWNGFALPPPPAAQAVDVNPLLRAAPPAPKPAAPAAAKAANAASAEANKVPEPELAPKTEAEAPAPKVPASSVPPYGPPGNTTAAPTPVLPVQPAPAQPTAPAPEPEPEGEPPL